MKKNIIKHWTTALRYHFTAPSFLAALFGSSMALSSNTTFNTLYFILLIVAIVSNHIALNMTDDYYDYLHNVDVLKTTTEKSNYYGGSGVLVEKKISPNLIKIAFFSFYAITATIGLYFFIQIDYKILLFGIIGFLSSYYYTAPPISFGYKGFGELAIFANFGPIIVIGSYYLQTQSIPLSIIIMSLPLGLLTFAMILFNEIPDFYTDLKANKKTLIVLFGKKNGINLAKIALIVTYIIIILSVSLNYINKIALMTLLTIPLAYKAIKLLKISNLGQLEMVRVHNIIGLLLIFANIIQAFINNNIIHSSIIMITSILLYLPIILMEYYN